MKFALMSFKTVLFCFLWMTCLLLINIICGPSVCLTTDVVALAAQPLPADVDEGVKQLTSIQKAKHSHEKKLHVIEGKKLELLGELERLDREMNFLHEVLEQKKQAKESNLSLLKQIESEYNKKKKLAEELKKHAKVRLKAFWSANQTGILNVLFGARTIPELLSKEMYMRYLLQKDRNLLSDYLHEMQQLGMTQKKLGQETSLLKQTEKEIQQQASALEQKLKQKKNLLASLSSDAARQQKIIAELEEAEARLQKMMVSLVSAKRDVDSPKSTAMVGRSSATAGLNTHSVEQSSASASAGFAAQKGRLPWPAVGRVFRPKDVASRCILIAIPLGTEVKAVYEGQVVYSGSLTGYGNAVILDHGEGYYSMTAQCMRVLKQVNDKVFEGENICTSGSGPWIGEGIYFEIRNAKGQEDPLSWLNMRSIVAFQNAR